MSRFRLAATLIVGTAGFTVALLAQQQPASPSPGSWAAAVPAVKHDTSPALRDIPPIGVDHAGDRPVHEPRRVPKNVGRKVPWRDPVTQDAAAVPLIAAPTVNFDGVSNLSGVLPPDTNGDVGPNHYVQWINLKFAIWSKSGTLLYGPADGRTLFTGFGGPCETTNDGDPIVLYDEAADRWLMTQFALPNFPSAPFYQCIAVSATSNPTGAYHRYAFSFGVLNDYPKFGVWRDGYYMTINQFAGGSFTWRGAGVAAFERDKMLLGQTARMIYKDMYSVDPNLGGMLPSDVDGTLPPAGTPNFVMQFDDNPDQMQVWAFTANWTTGSGTFSRVATVALPSLDSGFSCGSSGRDCIPQPGTSEKLDSLSDRLMFRLQYRNFGGYESFVTNHTVDVDGLNHAGVRWYEIRRANNAFSLHQSGTFAPDAHHRWMGSVAMDRSGGLGVAYNVSSSTVYPSVRYTGRLATSPLGVLDQGEADIMVGGGSQTHSASRWGDYSNLSVDPVDGCTFWATLEYMPSTSSAGWRTRVAAFKLAACGGSTTSPPTAPVLSLGAYSSTSVALSWTDSDSETSYAVGRCTGNGCTPATITTLGANVLSYMDATVAAATTYTYRVTATNAGGSTASNSVAVTTPAASPINAPSNLAGSALKDGGVRLTWTNNTTAATRIDLQRTGGSGPVTFTLGPTISTYTDTTTARRTRYTYQARACNSTTCSEWSNSALVRTR